jgi:hypothetical protein
MAVWGSPVSPMICGAPFLRGGGKAYHYQSVRSNPSRCEDMVDLQGGESVLSVVRDGFQGAD